MCDSFHGLGRAECTSVLTTYGSRRPRRRDIHVYVRKNCLEVSISRVKFRSLPEVLQMLTKVGLFFGGVGYSLACSVRVLAGKGAIWGLLVL